MGGARAGVPRGYYIGRTFGTMREVALRVPPSSYALLNAFVGPAAPEASSHRAHNTIRGRGEHQPQLGAAARCALEATSSGGNAEASQRGS